MVERHVFMKKIKKNKIYFWPTLVFGLKMMVKV